ncbi:MAG: hypothetical protein V1692_01785, partial [bacterium]
MTNNLLPRREVNTKRSSDIECIPFDPPIDRGPNENYHHIVSQYLIRFNYTALRPNRNKFPIKKDLHAQFHNLYGILTPPEIIELMKNGFMHKVRQPTKAEKIKKSRIDFLISKLRLRANEIKS